MKKLLWVSILIFCVSFPCGSLFGSESKKAKLHILEAKDFHVLKVAGTGEVVIDANDSIAKPKMKFDIFKTADSNDSNNVIDGIALPAARIIITQTTPTYSVGTIVSRMDGSKPKSSDISKGMLCRETTKATLKAEKEIDKNQKKALKQQKQKPFNVQDLKLGMDRYEVTKICKGPLEFIATEAIPDSNGCSKTVYRMWPNEVKGLLGQRIIAGSPAANLWARNKDIRPYQLAFVVAPPLTKEQCEQAIVQANITDPNDIQFVRSMEGFCFSRLISVSQDMEMIKLQAVQQAQQSQNYQLQEINRNLEQIRMQNFQRQTQEDFYRMQRNR